MKLKCNKCNDIVENKNLNKEILCSCKSIGIFNDYILYGDNNKLKDKSYISFNAPDKSWAVLIS